jgi:hypothetical protein
MLIQCNNNPNNNNNNPYGGYNDNGNYSPYIPYNPYANPSYNTNVNTSNLYSGYNDSNPMNNNQFNYNQSNAVHSNNHMLNNTSNLYSGYNHSNSMQFNNGSGNSIYPSNVNGQTYTNAPFNNTGNYNQMNLMSTNGYNNSTSSNHYPMSSSPLSGTYTDQANYNPSNSMNNISPIQNNTANFYSPSNSMNNSNFTLSQSANEFTYNSNTQPITGINSFAFSNQNSLNNQTFNESSIGIYGGINGNRAMNIHGMQMVIDKNNQIIEVNMYGRRIIQGKNINQYSIAQPGLCTRLDNALITTLSSRGNHHTYVNRCPDGKIRCFVLKGEYIESVLDEDGNVIVLDGDSRMLYILNNQTDMINAYQYNSNEFKLHSSHALTPHIRKAENKFITIGSDKINGVTHVSFKIARDTEKHYDVSFSYLNNQNNFGNSGKFITVNDVKNSTIITTQIKC